ncbi:hypothetical protein GSI_04041 [Ganoderma sinense ZZ0214-1]|uniref:Uncharacterized protein n=1 Tax=Ganoderma sinense ZZ0214-1 TaxID=1077348 RepID=A0A2G8SI22_9APHY|nr:hypothetical protein GSI_04041 [Ganoderma sinense ZZ0214-1]
MDETALKALDRKALQKLAKTNGIKANLKSTEIIKQLLANQPSQPSSPPRRPTASPSRRRLATPPQPQPNDAKPSPPREDEDEFVPVFPPASPRARGTRASPSRLSLAAPAFEPRPTPPWLSKSWRRPTTRAQPPTSKARPAQSHGDETAAECGQAGPSRAKGKAPTLGVFNESSASRAPWPQEPRNLRPRSLTPFSPPAGSPKPPSNIPTFPPGTHPYSVSTGIPKGYVFPPYHPPQMHGAEPAAEAGTSASASHHGPIVPDLGYRSRSPTPLEEYDSMRGVPLFAEPGSDYEESWTPYSSPGQPSPDHLQAPAGHPDGLSPVFPLSRAVFSPPKPVLAPPRSPVFRRPSNPRRPTNPVGRDDDSPEYEPDDGERDGAAIDAGDELEDYEEAELAAAEEDEEDEGRQPATDALIYKMVVRLSTLARHQSEAEIGVDDIVGEVNRVRKVAPRFRAQMRSERASLERMRAYLAHVNTRVGPAWDHKEIWDEARILRADKSGNQIEVETDDEEEAQWRRDNPRPPKALPTEIEMRRITPWFPGVCEDEDRENVRDIGEAIEKCRAEWKEVDAIRARADATQLEAPSTPKRRRDDDDDDDEEEEQEDGGRPKKKVRGSAGRTPPPSAFFQKGQKGGRADGKAPLLVGIAEEDSEEEIDMEMTSVV